MVGLSAGFLRERQWWDVWERCRSFSLRGLVEDWTERSGISGHGGVHNGNYWSDSRKMRENVWPARKRRVRACVSFSGVSGCCFFQISHQWCRVRSQKVRDGKAAFGPGRSRGKSGVDVWRVTEFSCDWVVPLRQAMVKTDCTPERLWRNKNRRRQRF